MKKPIVAGKPASILKTLATKTVDKNASSRRGLIKRALVLVGGILIFGVGRRSSGATKPAQFSQKPNKANRGVGVRQHWTEGKLLDLPVQNPRENEL
jgi:hypothetical protein